MGESTALVTGAGGEMGRLLVPALAGRGYQVIALDRSPMAPELTALCRATYQADILETERLAEVLRAHPPTFVFHLAAMLSASAEHDPDLAHRVNVEATLALFRLCRSAGPVRFLFPSSIAVYGLPDRATKDSQGALKEWQWTTPTAMYGCNKLYCELVGAYVAKSTSGVFDFRSIRFPGLISADTLPSGGTTDFAPEMIHSAARGEPYVCFVREDSRLPFMTMPDAIDAVLALAGAEASRLTTRVYNIKGFACSAGEIRDEVLRHFPRARITFESLPDKQRIVDSWPADVDDSRARRDWELTRRHGLAEAFGEYLVPALNRRYGATVARASDPAPRAGAPRDTDSIDPGGRESWPR